jgi:hypothetical protein
VRVLYLRRRDEYGRLVLDGAPPAAGGRREVWRDIYRRRGWPEHRVEALLKERLGRG